MKWILLGLSVGLLWSVVTLKKQVKVLKGQNDSLTFQTKKRFDSLYTEHILLIEDCRQLENAVETLQKEDPTITMRWDLLINGISIKK